ncbi:MAG: hypothetical protein RL210_699 [Pseudomonadota bacterium]
MFNIAETEVQQRLQQAEARCLEQGMRLTTIRKQVLELLLRHEGGVKAYQLLDEMKAVHEQSTPPTVYRALEFLQDAGLVHRLDSLNAYVACHIEQPQHQHGLLLVCPLCHAVSEIDDPEVCHLLADRIRLAGHQLQGDCLEIKAVCGECANATVPAACCNRHPD